MKKTMLNKVTTCLLALLMMLLIDAPSVFAQVDGKKENKYLTGEEYALFKNIALEKANYFFFLLNRIGNKSTPRDSVKYYIREAEILFHDSAIVEVKSSDNKSARRPLKIYLNRISQLNYTELRIQVFSAFFVTDLKYVSSSMKGKVKITEYEGVIAFEQYFEGKVGTEVKYKDTSLKAMKVHVMVRESDIGKSWNVLLGDIWVLSIS